MRSTEVGEYARSCAEMKKPPGGEPGGNGGLGSTDDTRTRTKTGRGAPIMTWGRGKPPGIWPEGTGDLRVPEG